MTKTMLKTIRLLAPGVIILLGVFPFVSLPAAKAVSEALPGDVLVYIVIIVALVLGGAYYAFDLRGFLWRPFVKTCHDNVWSTIIKPHLSDPIVKSKLTLINNKVIMRIFYNIVDNDPSLTDQAHDVRMNGALLSTVIDGILLLPFTMAAFVVAFLFVRETLLLVYTCIILVVQIVLGVARPVLIRKHLNLENEQLATITQNYSAVVLKRLQNL